MMKKFLILTCLAILGVGGIHAQKDVPSSSAYLWMERWKKCSPS